MEAGIVIQQLVDEVRGLRLEVDNLRREFSTEKRNREFLTLIQACDYLNIKRTAMQTRLANGDINFAVKKGNRWLFPLDKLREYASGF